MKLKSTNTFLFFLVACFAFESYAFSGFKENSDQKKFQRLKERADRKFNAYSYQEAIANYKKALDVQLDREVKLQLANCYRLLNDPDQAAKWYELALEDGGLSPEDMLHYGQVLSALERYEESVKVLERYQNRENWIDDKVAGLKEVEKFYRNEEAFTINESIFNSAQKDFSPTHVGEKVVFVTGRPSPGLFKPEYNWDSSNFLDLFEVSEGMKPTKIHRGINTRYHEGPATFFENDQKMLFTRNNYFKKKASKSDDGVNKLKLYYAERKNESRWKKPHEVPFNSDQYSVGHPTITSDGVVYFASDMPGGYGGVDIYKTTFRNGVWGEPQNMGRRINTERNEMFPFVHNDSTLYFSSDGHEGLGGLDLFRVSLYNEFKPRNLGYPLNTNSDDFGLTLKRGTNKGYFSSNRDGGEGDDDIYEVIIFDYIITVILIDEVSGEEISGDMNAYEIVIKDKDMVANCISKSRIVFPALRGTNFSIDGISPEYMPDTLSIETSGLSRDVVHLTYELPLRKIKGAEVDVLMVVNNGIEAQAAWTADTLYNEFAGSSAEMSRYLEEEDYTIVNEIVLKNIFYDFDKYNIREDAARELDKLSTFLIDNPTVDIDLGSHTDIRGSHAYNEVLARRRAESARDYLIAKGVDKQRIAIDSFGEVQTFDACVDCNKSQHQMNRRTEIRLIF